MLKFYDFRQILLHNGPFIGLKITTILQEKEIFYMKIGNRKKRTA